MRERFRKSSQEGGSLRFENRHFLASLMFQYDVVFWSGKAIPIYLNLVDALLYETHMFLITIALLDSTIASHLEGDLPLGGRFKVARAIGEGRMFITVVICTRNRAESLRETLESLFCAGSLQAPDWEVLVVDNNSGDHTAEICREFQQRIPGHFRFLTERRPGKSRALNTAIAAAQGDILAFTDDDVLCAPDYIQSIRTFFGHHQADAVQGRVLLDCEGGHPDWLDRFLGLSVGWRDEGDEVIDLDGTLCGTNMVVRREVFQRIGGFRPELGPGVIGLGEETELSLRMRKIGCRLLYAPQILIRHRLPRRRLNRGFLRKRFFQQGRAAAYYAPLPVSLIRFGLYVVKETIVQEVAAIWHLRAGNPALALRCQCEARSHAGFLWQHSLFERRVPRALSEHHPPARRAEVRS
jgi:glucosyl-dolichyl phosphate glucuronosyltransferase